MWEKQIEDIVKFVASLPDERTDAVQPTRSQFTRLLAEPAAARRVPGIPARMNENENYKCSKEEAVLTKQFMKLIDWGEANKIKYRPNLAPAEYTDLIVQNVVTDEKKAAANNSGHLFEKALYDKNVLSSEEEKLFVESIKKVLQCG